MKVLCSLSTSFSDAKISGMKNDEILAKNPVRRLASQLLIVRRAILVIGIVIVLGLYFELCACLRVRLHAV